VASTSDSFSAHHHPPFDMKHTGRSRYTHTIPHFSLPPSFTTRSSSRSLHVQPSIHLNPHSRHTRVLRQHDERIYTIVQEYFVFERCCVFDGLDALRRVFEALCTCQNSILCVTDTSRSPALNRTKNRTDEASWEQKRSRNIPTPSTTTPEALC
jgi:hypothetical protein